MFQALKEVEGELTSGTSRSSDEDKPISSSLDLTSPDIFRNLATLAEQETEGNKGEMKNLYGQSFDPLRKN